MDEDETEFAVTLSYDSETAMCSFGPSNYNVETNVQFKIQRDDSASTSSVTYRRMDNGVIETFRFDRSGYHDNLMLTFDGATLLCTSAVTRGGAIKGCDDTENNLKKDTPVPAVILSVAFTPRIGSASSNQWHRNKYSVSGTYYRVSCRGESFTNSSSIDARIFPSIRSSARNLSFVCCKNSENNTDVKVVGIDVSDTKSTDASTIDARWRYPSIDRTYQNLNSWVLVVSLQCTDVTGVYISLHAAQMSCLKLLNCSGVSGSANYADGYFETCAGPVMLAAPMYNAENSHRVVLAPKAVLQIVGVNLGEDNLALGRSAQQSNQSHGGIASRAVDGVRTSNYNAGSCTHTDTVLSWWQVDLAELYVIAAVSVKLNEINLPP